MGTRLRGVTNQAPTVELDAQYRQLREECGLVERPGHGRLLFAGPDAAEYLQGQLTNDIEALEPGEGCYAALLDRKAHIQGDMRVLRLAGDEIAIDLEPEALPAVSRHLDMYKIGREVEMTDVTADWELLSLIGPAAPSVTGSAPGLEHASAPITLAGSGCLAVSTALGIDIFAPVAGGEAVRAALVEAGAREAGEAAAEVLRVELGTPRFGHELSSALMPAEAGIVERAVNFEKGCYIGQEPVARLHYRGRPNRTLRGLKLAAAAEDGAIVTLGDRELGSVTTAVLSPALGPIALAVLRREAEPGSTVEVAGAGAAEVIELPFRELP